MFRISCCQLCSVVRRHHHGGTTGVMRRAFSSTQLNKWKRSLATSSSSSSRVATKAEVKVEEITEQSGGGGGGLSGSSESASSSSSSSVFPPVSPQPQPHQPPTPTSYFPTTVAQVVQSVKHSDSEDISSKPLQLLHVADPGVLEQSAPLNGKELLKCYLGLSKSRLTGLVVVTAMAGYALAPAPFTAGAFLCLSLGTGLTSAAANTVNQIVEVPYDSQMDRTKNRVLVRQRLSKEHAALFALMSGVGGLTLLSIGANGLTGALGALNLVLYTCVYTPMKRQSIANTWIGSIVGGIPPLMGWVACTGEISHGALLLGGILYAWQFPHFNALSWNLRHDYNKAGYKMMAISHPELCKKTSLRYSLSLILMSSLAPVCNVTSWTFVIDSLPLNGYLAYLAYKFYQHGDSASSRKLFRFSLIHLPTLILLMMVSKKAYKDKECPVAAAIKEASSIAAAAGVTVAAVDHHHHHAPPAPPVVFPSIEEIDNKSSSSVQLESQSTQFDALRPPPTPVTTTELVAATQQVKSTSQANTITV